MADERTRQVSGWTGWVGFAGYMMIFSGILQFIYGLGALFNQNWFIAAGQQVWLVNLATWGWFLLLTGVLLVVSGSLLLAGNAVGRAIGVVLASVNLLSNLALFSVTPWWSVLGIAVNALVIYAIWTHGGDLAA